MDNPPIYTWKVPGSAAGQFVEISAKPGRPTIIVGANGSGKSALATWMMRLYAPARRLIAHRKLWLTSSGPDLSPSSRQQLSLNLSNWDQRQDSRYMDHGDSQRSAMVLFDFLDRIAQQNRRIIDLYDNGGTRDSVGDDVGPRVLDVLNHVMAEGNLHVRIREAPLQTLVVEHRDMPVEYPIHQMSDGERSAVLLAAEVLGADSGTVFIIDEPERHLHPAVSVGLIRAVVDSRNDCAFIIISHDLELASAMASQRAQSLVLSGCTWTDQEVTSWDLMAVPPGDSLPESARRAVLGGRKKVLCIEGESSSLDKQIYRVLFPGWSLYAAGGCEQVIRAVSGIRQTSSLNWITAVGVVDRDGRTSRQVQSLRNQQVVALPVSEIECMLYLTSVISAVALRQADTLGESANHDAMVASAIRSAISCVGPDVIQRLSRKIARERLVRSVVEFIPDVLGSEPIRLELPVDTAAVEADLRAFCSRGDLDGLVTIAPIRDTAVRARVSAALHFRHFEDYEKAAIVALQSSEPIVSELRARFGELPV